MAFYNPIEIEAPHNAVLSCDPRRVLIVAPQPFYQDRGTPIALRYILKALSDLGYPVDVLTFPLGRSLFEIPGVRVFRTRNPLGFRSIPVGFSFKKLFLDFLLMQLLRKRLREERYLCVHAVEEAAFFAAVLCRSQGIFVIYDMESSLPEQLAQNIVFRSRTIQALSRRLERWLLSNVHYVTCSAGLSAHVRSLAPGTPLQEWYFPTAISSVSANEVAALRAELKISKDTKVVLYTGTFAKYQGVEMLIKAIPRVLVDRPKTVFVLVGATKAECSTTVQAAGGSLPLRGHVRLLPRQPRDRIECFLALADLLISPRIHGANLPLKVFDYMAAGKPIVATDIPGHRAVLDDTRAVLVPPSAEALAEAVAQILADSERAMRLGVAVRAYAKARLTWPRFMDSMGEIYRQVHAYVQAH